ncbi:MAG: NUDIX domain-containing protein [Clostridia bacterium]|nr:NUDIX domain-containing protein [Clostridia bacterium]MDE7329045.1 NUDIX domain-containing protein [Clostridia bacterium]
MKTIEIFDGDFSKEKVYGDTRNAVRAVIIYDGKLFVEKASTPEMLMLPGGGVENEESVDECVIRECKEECGLIVQPLRELFAIREYFRDRIFYSTYVACEIVGNCENSLTDGEKALNLVCEWQDLGEILSRLKTLMEKYEGVDDELHGCHQREYLAVKELISGVDSIK